VKYLLLATLFAGLVLLPGSAIRAEDTLPSPETIVQKEGGIISIPTIIRSTRHATVSAHRRPATILSMK
jgi:hypothetical protein